MADDLETKVASTWTDETRQVMQHGADAVITRLQAPINRDASLTPEKISVQQAGNDVYVEQLSTTVDSDGIGLPE